MPPRKSDVGARKSEVSAARFVLDDDEQPGEIQPAVSVSLMAPPPAPAPPPAEEATAVVVEAAAPSAVSPQPTQQGGHHGPSSEKKEREKDKDKEAREAVAIEDLTLPKSIITRLAKGVLPPNTQIQANAILAMTKSATVFISHLADAANSRTLNNNKKTIMPQDVLDALDDIEFGYMRDQLEIEFAKFNHVQTSKRSTYRKKVAAAKKGPTEGPDASMMSMDATGLPTDMSAMDDSMAAGDADALPRAKKLKTDDSQMDIDDDDDGAREPSDAETVPDEHDQDEDEDEGDEVEVEEENEEEEEERAGEERDELEDRPVELDEDEALDGDDSE